MKDLLRKLLKIQTLKLVLANPANVNMNILARSLEGTPTRIVISFKVEDVKVIDTGIVVRGMKNEN